MTLSCQTTMRTLGCQTTMGWLRLVGSLKSLVSFAEYRLFYRALLQKRPVILRSLLSVATPYEDIDLSDNCLLIFACVCVCALLVCEWVGGWVGVGVGVSVDGCVCVCVCVG